MAAVISFWVCFYAIKKALTGISTFISVVYPLIILSVILIQGSVYWQILLKRISSPNYAKGHTGEIYRFLKAADVILLCGGLFAIPICSDSAAAVFLSIFVWAFAVTEWVNYYIIRLSYGYDPMILLRHIKNKTLKKSRLAREIADR